MVKHKFRIYPSRGQLWAVTFIYLVIALSALTYLMDPLIRLLIALLSLLMCFSEWQSQRVSKCLCLQLDEKQKSIQIQTSDESHIYCKYKVYPARWFVILVLIDLSNTRTLVLNSDRFQTAEKYHIIRYCLAQMGSANHAA